MLMRIWTTGVRADREADYLRYANERSRPMFLSAPGCLGVLFLRLPDGRHAAGSFWTDEEDIVRLQESDSYRATVAGLLATGSLTGEQTLIVYAVEGGSLRPDFSSLVTVASTT